MTIPAGGATVPRMRYDAIVEDLRRGRQAEAKIRAAGGPWPSDRRRFNDAVAILDQTERDLSSGGLGIGPLAVLLWGAVTALLGLVGVGTYQAGATVTAAGQAARENVAAWVRFGGWAVLIGVTVAGVVAATPRLRRAVA